MVSRILTLDSYQFMPMSAAYACTAVLMAVLGWVVFLQERRSRISVAFLLLAGSMTIWASAITFILSSRLDAVAQWWIKYVEHLGVCFIPSTGYFFTVSIMGRYREFRRSVFLSFVYSVVCYFIFARTNWFLSDSPYVYAWGRYPHYLWPSMVFMAMFALSSVVNPYLAFSAYRRSVKNIGAARFRFLFTAFVVGYFGGVDFLPGFGVDLYPIGFLGTVTLIVLLTYAFNAYRFVDITPAAAADQIISTMKDMLAVADMDLKISFVNRAVSDMLGFSSADIVGRPAASLFGDSPSQQADFLRLLKDGAANDRELTIKTSTGKDLFVSVSISPWINRFQDNEGYIMIFRDVTDRKRAGEALLASEERFAKAFHAGPFLMSLSEAGTGRYIEVNNKFCEVSGYSREELLGRIPAETGWVTPELRRRLLKELGGASSARFPEVELRAKDGRNVICSYTVELVRLGDKDVLLSIVEDITGLKKAEAAMAAALKMESLGTLAGGIAHDFNNLLTGIIGSLSLIKTGVCKGAEVADLAREAETACFNAKGLARQLLTFASGGEPVKEILNIAALVKESVAFSLRGSSVGHTVRITGGQLFAKVDKDQFFQVIQNLVINASQAMPGGGSITVNADPVDLKAGEVPPLAPGRYVRIEVRDTGAGIAEDVKRKIFDPYFSTKAKGRGLGLAVCRSIIIKHGGQIGVESELSKGTVFTIHLPGTDAVPAAVVSPVRTKVPPRGAGRILVMDDEEVVYKVLKRMLLALGYEAEVAVSGDQALDLWQKAARSGSPFAAAIMDLTIAGGMGGAEAVKRLKELDPGAKAIVSSGYADDPIMADYESRGFCGVLVKPYSFEGLAAVLSGVLSS
ncbi:MAG: PAS domain S-box protein [Elusimicrobiales bacterium]|jgi:PAS domain S-box-containing protein